MKNVPKKEFIIRLYIVFSFLGGLYYSCFEVNVIIFVTATIHTLSLFR